jgi:hypothetical protein
MSENPADQIGEAVSDNLWPIYRDLIDEHGFKEATKIFLREHYT